MKTLYCDLETRSGTSLDAGVYRYCEDPEFRIILGGFAYDDEPVQVIEDEEEFLRTIGRDLADPNVLKIAHNSNFDRVCLSVARRRYAGKDGPSVGGGGAGFSYDAFGFWVNAKNGVPTNAELRRYLDPSQWDDTMELAAEWGYPKSLEQLAVALGAEEKDSAGKKLINLFCKKTRSGEWNDATTHPMEWMDFSAYAEQDVETLRDIHRRLPDWPCAAERNLWIADQRVNDRGVLVDLELAALAKEAADDNKLVQEMELADLVGVDNPNSTVQLIRGLSETLSLDLPDLKAETVTAYLRKELTEAQRRALKLRQDLALSASRKYGVALETAGVDGRIRGMFRFYGAHTGRWAGRGLQPQNLPRAQLAGEADVDAAILDLYLGLGAEAYTLKALVRSLFLGPFTVSDYSAIEARVIAWLAGEEWALRAFREGRDIYTESAVRMSTPNRKLTRSDGKVAVLALGYAGGVGSLRAMGAEGTDGQLQGLVTQWRDANQNITQFWKDMEKAFRHGGDAGEKIRVEKDGRDRLVWLPSGRALCYRQTGLKDGRITFADPRRPGVRLDTYGGRASENVTQAVARDVLGHALVEFERRGVPVVAHVHDEVIVESTDQDLVQEIMTGKPKWARGLPIDAESFTCERYRKS